MSLKHWAIIQGLKYALDFVEKSGKIEEIADEIDRKSAELANSEKASEEIQKRLVEKVLIALSRSLMKDNKNEWKAVLEKELLQV